VIPVINNSNHIGDKYESAFKMSRTQNSLYENILQQLAVYVVEPSMREGIKDGLKEAVKELRDFPYRSFAGPHSYDGFFNSLQDSINYLLKPETDIETSLTVARYLLNQLENKVVVLPESSIPCNSRVKPHQNKNRRPSDTHLFAKNN